MSQHTILYIINPAAGGGQARHVWTAFRSRCPHPPLPDHVRLTRKRGHARSIAASARDVDVLAVVGGDGTVAEVLSGIMDRPEPRPQLAVIPAGTGNDSARNLGVPSLNRALAVLRHGRSRPFDVLRIDCLHRGRPLRTHAFNAGSVGFPASALTMLKPWMKRLLPPKAAYVLSILLGIAAHRPPQMIARWTDGRYAGSTWMVAVANAERIGGGAVRIAPGASTNDGALNVTIVRSQPKRRIFFNTHKIATGTHLAEPYISYFPTTTIHIDSSPPSALEIDGDVLGTTPATFSVCPRAVRILCPRPPHAT